MTRRRWIADTWSPQSGHPNHATLIGEQAEHLARVLRAPFDEQPEFEGYAGLPPDWASDLEVSCSS